MCDIWICEISWYDSGTVYLGVDQVRNLNAEKTGISNLYFNAVEPIIEKYEKESLKKEESKKNDKNTK